VSKLISPELVLLTDAQLDIVAGGQYASGAVEAVNVAATGTINVSSSSTPPAASASADIFTLNNVGTATPQVLVVGLVATAPGAP
jgi:hypothetical protein